MRTRPQTIFNPKKRVGTQASHFIKRIVTDQIVFIATDGEVMSAGHAKINGKTEIVYSHNFGPYSILTDRIRIHVREIIPQKEA